MRAPTGSIQPSQQAQRLAETMVSETAVMREILEETIETDGSKVHESGRTICGSAQNIQGPLARFPSSVELAQCPRGVRGGTWHTHVTKTELRNPNNSLPDTANVIFDNIDVSAVVGTETVEVVKAAEDPEWARERFRDIIGADVDSTEDVIDAVIAGRIGNPTQARERLRSEMSPLFERSRTNFTDIDALLNQSAIPAASPVSFEMHEAQFYAAMTEQVQTFERCKSPRDAAAMRQTIRQDKDGVKPGEWAVKEARGAAIGEIVSTAINRILF